MVPCDAGDGNMLFISIPIKISYITHVNDGGGQGVWKSRALQAPLKERKVIVFGIDIILVIDASVFLFRVKFFIWNTGHFYAKKACEWWSVRVPENKMPKWSGEPNDLKLCLENRIFLAATKQLYEWYFLSVCPSVCPSVTPFWLCSHHRIIMKFSGVITLDQGKVHAKGQGQRSKVKVTEVTTQLFVSGL